MDSMYYKVMALILLFPWSLLGLVLLGYVSGRLKRRVRSV
jgi:NhaP-type Na+/H+ or K+/H+ antiporter